MIGEIYYKAKSLVRPFTQHRRLVERARYFGNSILSPVEGNDAVACSMGQARAIGKIGSSEMAALRHYWKLADSDGFCASWGWEARNLYRIAGVYPPDPAIWSKFCVTYMEALTHLDILAVWFNFGEHLAWRRFAPTATVTRLRALEPYFHDRPWTQRLEGQRVLVVSPFSSTIQKQYSKRLQLWPGRPEMLPEFDLLTLRTPLSAYLTAPEYPDWFTALDAMTEQMSRLTFDVAIVGAGAWSIPLVARAKSQGAWSIHLGGATQILFGIKGQAWERAGDFNVFFNDEWVRPSSAETPRAAQEIEGGRYW